MIKSSLEQESSMHAYGETPAPTCSYLTLSTKVSNDLTPMISSARARVDWSHFMQWMREILWVKQASLLSSPLTADSSAAVLIIMKAWWTPINIINAKGIPKSKFCTMWLCKELHIFAVVAHHNLSYNRTLIYLDMQDSVYAYNVLMDPGSNNW